jgi:uncharacterized membrane protein YozB (DUF420 family)
MADASLGRGTSGNWLAPLLLVLLLAAAAGWFVYGRLHYVSDVSLASYTPYFWPRRLGLLTHLAGGATAISVGLVQIWLGLTGRTNLLHRTLGKVYALGVAVGSAGGIYMALTIPSGMAYSSGLFFLATAWLITTGMALYAIRRRQFDQHRDWMLRSYTVTFAFVIFRLGEQILRPWLNMPQGQSADELDALMAWACWAIPLLVVEVFIQIGRVRTRAA